MTPDEVAELFGVTTRTVRSWAAAGRLRRIRLGHRTTRYTARSVAALIASERSEAAPAGGSAKTSSAGAHRGSYPES